MKKPIVALALALCCLLLAPALASASTPTLKSLAKTVKALQKTVKSETAAIASQGSTIAALTTDLTSATQTIATQATTITNLQGTIGSLQTIVGADASHGLQKSVADIAANPALTLSWLPTYLSLDTTAENGVSGPNIVFKGANVHVESSTSEADASGTGNLIVGWDDTTAGATRTGSNNLACGDMNTFASCGGFVDGLANSVNAVYASVSGGANNFAQGSYSSVSGGHANTAQSFGATISGGNGVVLNVPATNYAWQGGSYHTP